MRILILGANGFIGSNLCKRILNETQWQIVAIDVHENYLIEFLEHPQFQYKRIDVLQEFSLVEEEISLCDVVLPLVAIAQPKLYVSSPLKVFELTFEHNLKVIRLAVAGNKRLILPSTSEVYGMSSDDYFCEDSSSLVYGPIHKSRWIYATSKQLLDRVVYSYGLECDFRYTIFRPFNWIGPNLDTIEAARLGNSRVLTQFISNLYDNVGLKIVGDGLQKRSFTDCDDAMRALLLIIENEHLVNQEIVNIGNPLNEISILGLATLIIKRFKNRFGGTFAVEDMLQYVSEEEFYGSGFQDVSYRRPNIDKAKRLLNWEPKVSIEESVDKAIESWASMFEDDSSNA